MISIEKSSVFMKYFIKTWEILKINMNRVSKNILSPMNGCFRFLVRKEMNSHLERNVFSLLFSLSQFLVNKSIKNSDKTKKNS